MRINVRKNMHPSSVSKMSSGFAKTALPGNDADVIRSGPFVAKKQKEKTNDDSNSRFRTTGANRDTWQIFLVEENDAPMIDSISVENSPKGIQAVKSHLGDLAAVYFSAEKDIEKYLPHLTEQYDFAA